MAKLFLPVIDSYHNFVSYELNCSVEVRKKTFFYDTKCIGKGF